MADRPATPEDLQPCALPSYAGPARVTITYYRAQVQVERPVAGGGALLDPAECAHLHTTPEAADRCAATLARRLQREARAAFTPCACHGATPSTACTEHPEPIRYWAPDEEEAER